MSAHSNPSPPSSKKLAIRLSSLGDVILASSALEVARSQGTSLDWVVCREYAGLLQGHPGVGRIWEFDKKEGFPGWRRLSRTLWNEGYDEVFDLHSTLRSKLLKVFFRTWSMGRDKRRMPVWRTISKCRWRLYGYFLLKSFWPKLWRPEPIVVRSARLCGGSGAERPDLSHLLHSGHADVEIPASSIQFENLQKMLQGRPYLCVMPGSKWDGKKWPLESYATLLSRIPLLPVILGTPQDRESQELVRLLEAKGLPVISAVGNLSFPAVARVLAGARRYLGNDTGLGHLAEAMGVPGTVIFGPTREDMGFGPWRPESRAVGLSLGCRPCGKDGRFCYRLTRRFKCMKDLTAENVLSQSADGLGKS